MGLNHRFFCLRENEISYARHLDYFDVKPGAVIHDDIMRYMNDTFLWIPCTHLSGSRYRRNCGLELYGVTVINTEGATLFYNVIKAWVDLFSNAPAAFDLTGPVLLDSSRRATGEFYKIKVNRDVLVEALKTLTMYAEQAISGDYYVLHLGI